MTRKFLLVCGLLFASGLSFLASAITPHFEIETTSGLRAIFPLHHEPTITYSNNELHVEAAKGEETITAKATEVKSFKFSSEDPDLSGITDISKGSISGLAAGTQISIYNVSGVAVMTATATADGVVELNLDRLPSGIYIIATPLNSFKISK